MIRLLLPRLLLMAAPFVVYWLWREQARRTGRAMGSTPWGWLVFAGAILFTLSLGVGVMLHEDNRGETYVPAAASPDGHVEPGRFRKIGPTP